MTCSCNGVGSCSSSAPPVCGNGIIEGFEACDDFNIVSGDGCDSTCTIENYFDCSGSTLSTCWLVGPLLLTPINSVINPNHTSANLTFAVEPAFSQLETQNWKNLIVLNSSLSIDQFNYSSGVLNLVISSNQSLDG